MCRINLSSQIKLFKRKNLEIFSEPFRMRVKKSSQLIHRISLRNEFLFYYYAG